MSEIAKNFDIAELLNELGFGIEKIDLTGVILKNCTEHNLSRDSERIYLRLSIYQIEIEMEFKYIEYSERVTAEFSKQNLMHNFRKHDKSYVESDIEFDYRNIEKFIENMFKSIDYFTKND